MNQCKLKSMIQLFPFQKTMIQNIEKKETQSIFLHNNKIISSNISFLSDKTGKSISFIFYLMDDPLAWDMTTRYCKESIQVISDNTYYKNITYYKKIKPTLIITDKINQLHWKSYLDLTLLKVYYISSKYNIKNIDINLYDVVIVTTTTFNRFNQKFQQCVWKRVIIDKPETLDKLDKLNSIVYHRLWFITKYPSEFFSKYKMKKSNNWIMNTITNRNFHPNQYQHFQQFQEMVHHLSDINRYDEYPDKEIENKVYDCIIHSVESCQHHAMKMLQSFPESITNMNNILTCDLNKYVDQHKLTKRKQSETKDRSICSICHEHVTYPVLETNCCNIFCSKCLLQWISNSKKSSCPLCRSTINQNNLIFKVDSIPDEKNKKKYPYRSDIIERLIKQNKKVLIFSKTKVLSPKLQSLLEQKDLSLNVVFLSSRNYELCIKNYFIKNTVICFVNPSIIYHRLDLSYFDNVIFYGDTQMNDNIRIRDLTSPLFKKKTTYYHHFNDISKN